MKPLRTIEVCAGIGGITLGFELAGGFEPVAFVERDEYARSVLTRHWPDIPQYRDLRSVSAWNLPAADVIAGGIPCQPHSLAGQRRAGADERDLWGEFYRLVCEIRPRYAVVENVPGLRSSDGGRFFGTILSDLAAGGYDAEWVGLSAAEVGAPHKRDRVWIVAYPNRSERRSIAEGRHVHDRDDAGRQEAPGRSPAYGANGRARDLAGPERQGLALGQSVRRDLREKQPSIERGGHLPRRGWRSAAQSGLGDNPDGLSPWLGNWEGGMSRTIYGYAGRVDQLRCLGNAVVPQVAAVIGRYIQDHARRFA